MAVIRMMAAILNFVCPKCHLVQQFEGPAGGVPASGIPKCPKCGIMMQKK